MDELPIPSWDEYFLRKVYLTASKSKDPRTRIGSVLVKDNSEIASGYNGFPRLVKDSPERLLNRDIKLKFIVHSEVNALLYCARFGVSALGAILYTQGIPCDNCGKSIIQAGIKEVVIHKQWSDQFQKVGHWLESTNITLDMFNEANVSIREVDLSLNISALQDGKVILV